MSSRELWADFLKLLKHEDWTGASALLDKLIEREPGNPNYYLKKGDVCRKGGDNTAAVNAYLKAAWHLERDGFQKKALAVYKMVLRLDPDNLDATHKANALIMESSLQAHSLRHPSENSEQAVTPPEIGEGTLFADSGEPAESTPPAPGPVSEPVSLVPLPFTEKETEEIMGRSEVRSFSEGDTVIREGDSGDSIFMIRKGSAVVVAHILGKEIHLKTLTPGDLFGEVAFLTGRPRTANVIAADDLEVYEINRAILEDIIERRPEVMAQISEIYNSRVRDTITKVKSK